MSKKCKILLKYINDDGFNSEPITVLTQTSRNQKDKNFINAENY